MRNDEKNTHSWYNFDFGHRISWLHGAIPDGDGFAQPFSGTYTHGGAQPLCHPQPHTAANPDAYDHPNPYGNTDPIQWIFR